MKKQITFLIAALALVLAPTLFAQVDSFRDTIKLASSATIGAPNNNSFIVDVGELDSLHINAMFADSASGYITAKAYNAPNGVAALTGVAADTILLLEFGPTVAAARYTIPWANIKAATGTGYWNGLLPGRILITVTFYNDAASCDATKGAVKYFQLDVRKFKHRALDYGLETYVGVLKRSTTVSRLIRIEDIDSLQILVSYQDSAMGRIRISACYDNNGTVGAITGDTIMVKLLTGKNVGGGQNRFFWNQLKALQTNGAVPTWIQVDIIFDATVTALGDRFAVSKKVQLSLRKYRHT
jgi:hypothetical protein